VKRTIPLLLTVLVAAPAAHAGLFDFLKGLVKGNAIFISPPENIAMAKYHVLTLSSGGGAESSNLVGLAEEQLSAIKVGDVPYYSRVFRDAAPTSDKINIAAITIDAGQSMLSDRQTIEKRVQCPKGKYVCKNDEGYHYTVQCIIRSVVTPTSFTVRDNATNALLFTERRDYSSESKICSGEGGSLDTGAALMAKNYKSSVDALKEKIGPKLVKRPLDLIASDSSVTGPDAEKLKFAHDAASKNDMATACKSYDELNQVHSDSGVILFNMGYCRHANGFFAEAKDLYDKAAVAPGAPRDLLTTYQAELSGWLAKGVTSVIVKIPDDILVTTKPTSTLSAQPGVATPSSQVTYNQTPSNKVQQQTPTPVQSGLIPDVSQRLRQLKALYDDGVITKDDYDTKRKVLLESM